MTSLQEVLVELQDRGHTEPRYGVQRDPFREAENLEDWGDSGSAGKHATSTQGLVGETKDGVSGGQPVDGDPPKVERSTQEGHRARFYELYREGAEEYDKDFSNKFREDLDSALLFGGLFSIVVTAFIFQVQPRLQPDPNEETASLLRVLLYKIDNTTFGGDAPTLPQWNGPSQTIVQVQCLLYASLTTCILTTFLAILGKQWLNRYTSTRAPGSLIERSQNRQRKLDEIIAWYFCLVLELLPIMLQSALLLLGCAISFYLWEINTSVASVVLAMTTFGVMVYLVIVIVGTTSESCPYQTPAAFAMRRLLAIDIRNVGRATLRTLVGFANWARGRSSSKRPIPDQIFDNQTTNLDFRCSFWMLRESSDKAVKALTLNFLGTILSLAGLNSATNSAVVVDCFNILSSCFATRDDGAIAVIPGSEQLAGISAMCFFRAFSALLVTEPTSTVIRDVRQRYGRVFPSRVDLHGLPHPIIISATHHLFAGPQDRTEINWRSYNPTVDELTPFSRALAQVAQFEYHRGEGHPKVPQWLIRFALRFLSQAPLPPTSVVVDCLTIIATELGCTLPDANRVTSGQRALLEYLFTSIIQVYETIASRGQHTPESKGDATIAFLPYASRQEENGMSLPIPLKYAVVDAFRHSHLSLRLASNIGAMMQHWVTAASALPYTDDLGVKVVDTLLQMAFQDGLRQHIPVEAWNWLKRRPVLPNDCRGLRFGASIQVFQSVRETGDLELITSYLFVVWSKWSRSYPEGRTAMLEFIRSGLRGVEGVGYRADLIRRLNDVLSQMNPDSPTSPEAVDEISWYTEFRTALEEVN